MIVTTTIQTTTIHNLGSYDDTLAAGPVGFYERVNEIFSIYNNYNNNNNDNKDKKQLKDSSTSNFIVYFIDGDHHTYTDKTIYYTTDPINPTDNNNNSNSILLHSWTELLSSISSSSSSSPTLLQMLDDEKIINSICDGMLRTEDSSSISSLAEENVKNDKDFIDNRTYCDSRLFPKSFHIY